MKEDIEDLDSLKARLRSIYESTVSDVDICILVKR